MSGERPGGLGDRVSHLEQWKEAVAPSVARLIRDQEFRDRLIRERDTALRRWSLRAGFLVAVLSLGTLVAAAIAQLAHL